MINYKKNNKVKLFWIIKFTYNISKNANTIYIFLNLTISIILRFLIKKTYNFSFKSKVINKLVIKLKKLINK